MILFLLVCLNVAACNKENADQKNSYELNEAEDSTIQDNDIEDNDIEEDHSTEEQTLDDFSNVHVIGSQYDVISTDDKFWCLADTDNYLLQVDYTGKVYGSYARDDAHDAKFALTENRILFQNDEYYIYDLEKNQDVTNEYKKEDETIIYASDECVFLTKTEETYNSKNVCLRCADAEGKEIISFSTEEMSEKYNVEWEPMVFESNFRSCGSGIYAIQIDKLGNTYCFVDIVRNKVYAVTGLPQENLGDIYSDGNYIVYSQPQHGQAVIDCNTEQSTDFSNELYWMDGHLAEGKVSGKGYWSSNDKDRVFLNMDGSIFLDLKYEDTSVTEVSQFSNGFAMLEFNDNFVTIIDENGKFLFEPVEGKISRLVNINGKNIYIIFDGEANYMFLDETGKKSSTFAVSKDEICFAVGNDQIYLLVFGEESFSKVEM